MIAARTTHCSSPFKSPHPHLGVFVFLSTSPPYPSGPNLTGLKKKDVQLFFWLKLAMPEILFGIKATNPSLA